MKGRDTLDINPRLLNAEFTAGTGWNTLGQVAFAQFRATLKESEAYQSRLNQAFVLGENQCYLSFQLTDVVLDDVEDGPDDAFEVAVIDATTGASLLPSLVLNNTNAVLNLQAGGHLTLAAGVTCQVMPNGSRYVLIDLANVSPGTAINLSFDLIGFGQGAAATHSQVTIEQLRQGDEPGFTLYAYNDAASLERNGQLTLNVMENDDLAGLTDVVVVVVDPPQHGSLAQNANGSLTYTPDADWVGEDSFRYQLSHDNALSNIATVILAVVHGVMQAYNDAASLQRNGQLTLNVMENDDLAGRSGVVVIVVEPPQHGSLTQNANGSLTYTPDVDWVGEDSFCYQLSHDNVLSNIASVILTVIQNAINHPPEVRDIIAELYEDGTLTINLLAYASDREGDVLTVRILAQPQHGELVLNADGSATYTPHLNWSGEDIFTWTVNDGEKEAVPATVYLTVIPVADAALLSIANEPVPRGMENTLIPLPAISVLLADNDGSETLQLTIENLPVGSVLSDGMHHFTATPEQQVADISAWSRDKLTFTPPLGLTGEVSLTVAATATENANQQQTRVEQALLVTVLPVSEPRYRVRKGCLWLLILLFLLLLCLTTYWFTD